MRNEPLTDFSVASNRDAFRRAIAGVRAQLGRSIPLLIGDRRVTPARSFERENPSRLDEVIGRVGLADPSHAEEALAAAARAAPAWRATPVLRRAELLRRAAEILRRRHFELAAWEALEVGKPWAEADADVAEAIDYFLYYPEQMLRLEGMAQVMQVPGEQNVYLRRPLGVGAAISPWNFPLAIPAGMLSAALVTGNPVILKPAEPSSILAFHLVEILREAGVPPGVVQCLPGVGEEVGAQLVRSPLVRWICFTGSKEVGLQIVRAAAEVPAGQHHVKRVIAEMGGKNAIVVDQDADLDEAVLGVAASAFGYQGQKCSACSRVIVLRPVLARFLDRLIEATRSLPIGEGEDPGTLVGPLVNRQAKERVERAIAQGKKEATLAFEGSVPAGLNGHFVAPAIFSAVRPESELAQEEIFGPVLAVLEADSFDEALGLANGVPYALTGGVYSRSPAHVERAKQELRVGNLYVNRRITGAVVGRQPFGGLNLSGIGYKAGGPDYLLQFLQAQTITENTTRHGFAPLEEDETPAPTRRRTK